MENEEELPVEPSWRNHKWKERQIVNLKYVDDNLACNKIHMENEVRDGSTRIKHAVAIQNNFRWIVRTAQERGMKVNASKTAMVCISDAQSYIAGAFFRDTEGNEIRSGGTMKVLL